MRPRQAANVVGQVSQPAVQVAWVELGLKETQFESTTAILGTYRSTRYVLENTNLKDKRRIRGSLL